MAHDSLWIGFWLNRPIAERIAIDGGETPEELHMTLVYVPGAGNMEQDKKQMLLDTLSGFAKRNDPITGLINGLGRFFASSTSDGKDVIYASFDGPQLPEFRQELVQTLKRIGVQSSEAHGYTPHITLAYADTELDAVLSHDDSVDVSFPWLTVQFGEEQNHVFPLMGEQDSSPDPDQWRVDVNISKMNNDQRLVFGWLSVSEDEQGNLVIDNQDDIIEPNELERVAYDFVLYARAAGEMHVKWDGIGRLVESIVFTKEKQQALGIPVGALPIGWWVGFKIDDDNVWKKVKSGEYGAFSFGGKGIREEVT